MNAPTLKTIFYYSLIYFAGICVIFPIYLGLQAGFMNMLSTIQRVLYVNPAIIPSPLAPLFLILPVMIWRAWDKSESGKAFFLLSLTILVSYAIMLRTWLTIALLASFVVGFVAAAGIKYMLDEHTGLSRRTTVALSYLLAGPIIYWLLAANS